MNAFQNVTVVGAGAWGTALAATARRAGRTTRLYAREAEVTEAVNAGQGNPVFLKDIKLPDGIRASSDLEEATGEAEVVILVVPAQFLRAAATDLAELSRPQRKLWDSLADGPVAVDVLYQDQSPKLPLERRRSDAPVRVA